MRQNAKNLLGAHLSQNAEIGVQATGQRPKCIRMQGIGWGPPGQNTGNNAQATWQGQNASEGEFPGAQGLGSGGAN